MQDETNVREAANRKCKAVYDIHVKRRKHWRDRDAGAGTSNSKSLSGKTEASGSSNSSMSKGNAAADVGTNAARGATIKSSGSAMDRLGGGANINTTATSPRSAGPGARSPSSAASGTGSGSPASAGGVAIEARPSRSIDVGGAADRFRAPR